MVWVPPGCLIARHRVCRSDSSVINPDVEKNPRERRANGRLSQAA
jgi:hypothetical protein